mgnify:CR=1 FL=1
MIGLGSIGQRHASNLKLLHPTACILGVSASGGKTVIIKEKAVPGAAQPQAAPAPKPKKKEGDEFKEEKPQW